MFILMARETSVLIPLAPIIEKTHFSLGPNEIVFIVSNLFTATVALISSIGLFHF